MIGKRGEISYLSWKQTLNLDMNRDGLEYSIFEQSITDTSSSPGHLIMINDIQGTIIFFSIFPLNLIHVPSENARKRSIICFSISFFSPVFLQCFCFQFIHSYKIIVFLSPSDMNNRAREQF